MTNKMNRISVIIGGILLLLNLIFGLIISNYRPFNWLLNSGVIIANVVMLYFVSSMKLKDAFRVSLNCLFPLLGFIELICGFCGADQFEDNYCFVAILLLLLLQVLLLVSANYISNKIE